MRVCFLQIHVFDLLNKIGAALVAGQALPHQKTLRCKVKTDDGRSRPDDFWLSHAESAKRNHNIEYRWSKYPLRQRPDLYEFRKRSRRWL